MRSEVFKISQNQKETEEDMALRKWINKTENQMFLERILKSSTSR